MKLDIFKDRDDRFRWSLVAGNNRIVADSGQSYKTRSGAFKAFQSICFWINEHDYIRQVDRSK